MVGLHIKKELFFREYLGILAADTSLLHFFLAPQTNRFSDEYIRFHFPPDSEVWSLLGLMAREYASKNERAQTLLHSLMGMLTLCLSRKYSETYLQKGNDGTLAARMRLCIEEHSDDVTLGDLAIHFGYHPNYISS